MSAIEMLLMMIAMDIVLWYITRIWYADLMSMSVWLKEIYQNPPLGMQTKISKLIEQVDELYDSRYDNTILLSGIAAAIVLGFEIFFPEPLNPYVVIAVQSFLVFFGFVLYNRRKFLREESFKLAKFVRS